MKPINIYALTRITDTVCLERLERQMSKRKKYLNIKSWEVEGLRAFCKKLGNVMEDAAQLDFYYSFVMPKLGKEFDLLRIGDEFVVNVELKSGDVTDETIQRQLLQNRYYLATLGKNMYFYTYISGGDRLVRLTNSGRLIEADWEELSKVLEKQEVCYDDHIEELFKEDQYLISPLTDPARFLRQDYFLTSQQKDIKKQILKNIGQKSKDRKEEEWEKEKASTQKKQFVVQGFTGLPGTGKTLLLYDIAMQLSQRAYVCVLHLGAHTKELEQLDERLKRIDFYYRDNLEDMRNKRRYSAIFVDEGHRVDRAVLNGILRLAEEWNVPVIFSYDLEDVLFKDGQKLFGAALIEEIPGFVGFHLTNRIRLNKELSTFIRCALCYTTGNHLKEYPSVSLAYAADGEEAGILLRKFQNEGYVYIRDAGSRSPGQPEAVMQGKQQVDVLEATCKEYSKVVMRIDRMFRYDERGYLCCEGREAADSGVRNLFHGLNRAKEGIAIVVEGNEPVFETLLSIVQR